MLTVPRATVRQFLQVLRKAGLHKPLRSNLPPCVRLVADGQSLTFQATDLELSVSWAIPLAGPAETLLVPLSLLAEASQRTEGDVSIAWQINRLIATWTDRGMPVERDADPIDVADVPPFPDQPTTWAENPSTLLAALRDAMATTDPDSQRFALGCVQLDGKEGRLASTDSRQALLQDGFQFPWPGDVLIPSRKVFGADVFTHDVPVRIGRTETHVTLQAGAWTIAFTIRTEGRFPDISKIIPADSAVRTRLRLHPDDVRFATARLDQLPMDDKLHQAVTVDLNGAVALRARRSAEAAATELILRRSERDGDELRLVTDRRYLRRAFDLGFPEIGFTSPDSPAVCRDDRRQYVWMVLNSQEAVPPSDKTFQLDSINAPSGRRPSARSQTADARPTPVSSDRRTAVRPVTAAVRRFSPMRNSPMPKPSDSLPHDRDLVAQLLDLRKQVRAIEQAVVAVARQLRARRKQQQLMKSTLASLKQLQTLDV